MPIDPDPVQVNINSPAENAVVAPNFSVTGTVNINPVNLMAYCNTSAGMVPGNPDPTVHLPNWKFSWNGTPLGWVVVMVRAQDPGTGNVGGAILHLNVQPAPFFDDEPPFEEETATYTSSPPEVTPQPAAAVPAATIIPPVIVRAKAPPKRKAQAKKKPPPKKKAQTGEKKKPQPRKSAKKGGKQASKKKGKK